MCGLAGFISFSPVEDTNTLLLAMADALRHRGPVGEGYWHNHDSTVHFAHRRLAILDLSETAAQPLHYLHYTIIFNGEIYNYKELRDELRQAGYTFVSTGDTEVIPAAYDHWGIDFLHRLDGMFAFAIYNNHTTEVLIGRDRFGEKPLYYTETHNNATNASNSGPRSGIMFASEMKALWAAGVPKQANDTMLLNYITLGYVQDPSDKAATFYNGIYALPAAHFLLVNTRQKTYNVKRWYNPGEKIVAQSSNLANKESVIERYRELLFTSVTRRLRSDVPVGTSLSGGLDSSAIVGVIHALLESNSKKRENNNYTNAFSAVFPGFDKDESKYSEQVARQFNLTQHKVFPTADDFATHWQTLMHYQEEPVQSSSVLTQYLVYSAAKENNVIVLLDGQGADETLGGYKKYTHWYLQQAMRNDFKAFKKEKALLRKNELLEQWGLKNYAAAWLPVFATKFLSERAKKQQQQHPFLHRDFFAANFHPPAINKPVIKTLDDILFYNSFVFGLEELLRYADRNSMAHSREVRLPFLYHELVEFTFSLPANYKIRDGFTKWILRKAMEVYLPAAIIWRRNKIGFEPPQQQWMKQPAVVEMIMESRKVLVKKGVLQTAVLNQPVQATPAHAAGNFDWRYMSAAAAIL